MHKAIPEPHPKLAEIQYIDCSTPYNEKWGDIVEQLEILKTDYLTEDNARFIIQYMELAKDQQSKHNYENALTTFQDVLRFASPSLKDDIHYEIAVCHMRLKRFEEAENELRLALDYNPQHTQALVRKAELLRRKADQILDSTGEHLGDRDSFLAEARAIFQKSLKVDEKALDENGESIWASLGGILKRMGERDKAIEAYKRALVVKRSSYPLNNLGLLYIDKNEYSQVRYDVPQKSDSKIA